MDGDKSPGSGVLHKGAMRGAVPQEGTPRVGVEQCRYQRWESRYWLGEKPVRARNWRLKALWSV